MDYPFRKELMKETKSYANNTPISTEKTLDCSLGVNPYGYPKEVENVLKDLTKYHFSDYPHPHNLLEAVIKYWSKVCLIKESEVTFCNGSVCGLYALNNIFAQGVRREVVGIIPSFTDMIESVRNYGMEYIAVPVDMNKNGKIDTKGILDKISEKTAFIYIDRPNNPTGQTMPLSELEEIIIRAKEFGAFVISDEAYGDFIPREEAALTLFNKYDNLIVVKTFSKGFGLADLRGGYILAPEVVTTLLKKTSNPYILGVMYSDIFEAALKNEMHPISHASDFAKAKNEVISKIGNKVMMLETDPRVPICTLMLKENGNLQELLLKEDILAVSGLDFDFLDERSVRLRFPTIEHHKKVIDAILKVNE